MKPLHRGRFLAPALVLATAASCTGNDVTTPISQGTTRMSATSRVALAERVARTEIAAASRGDDSRGIESVILRMEGELPGIGGMFYDTSTFRMVVYVQDDSQRERAAGLVRAYLNQARVVQPEAERASQQTVDVRRGQYAFSQLVGWSRVLTRDLLGIPGWISIDADERMNRVRISVVNEDARQAVEEVLVANGVPAAGVTVELGTRVSRLATLQDWFARPVGGGVQIENSSYGLCSIGWTATQPDGTWGFLTAGHCTSYSVGGGQTGDTFYQNLSGAGNEVGTVQINPAWNLQCTDPSGASYPGRCTDADALFVVSNSSLVAKKVAQTSDVGINNQPGSLNMTGWLDVQNAGATGGPAVGYYAQKVGRTTGKTKGVVQGTAETVRVCEVLDPNNPANCLSEYLLTNQDRVTGASVGGGDSGGPVFPLTAQVRGQPPAPLTPWGITVAGTAAAGNPYCSSNCTLYFTTVTSIRSRMGQNFNFGP